MKRKKGFSLAEMMMVMLIISILTAAMLPVVTKRQKDAASGGGHCLWNESTNNSADIFSREGSNAAVIVGAANRLGSGNEKMQINATSSATPQLGLAVNGVVTGALWADSSNDLFIGSITKDSASTNNNTVIGQQDTLTSANSSTVLGAYTKGGNSGVAIGVSANSRGNYNTAVGYNAQVTGDSKIAIGANSVVNTSGKSLYIDPGAEGIALGNNSKSSDGGISIGYSATTSFNQWQMLPPIAIGYNSSATDGNSIAIGGSASAPGIGGIAIGPLASATGNTAIAIGSNEYGQLSGNGSQPNTTAKGWANVAIGNFTNAGPSDNAVVVGPYSSATGYGSTAIGAYTSATANYSTAIGYNAQSTTANQIVIGTTSDTVYIPGHLVVGKNTILGARAVNDNINYQVYLKGGNKGAYSSWVFLGTDDYRGGDDNFYRVGSVTAGNITINGDNGPMPSDRRLKNVKGLNNDGLDKINQLKVYNYNFKKDKKHSPRVGVIAQDLQKVFPNSVKKSRSGYLFIRWDEMFYAMVNSIKELDLKFKDLSEKISTLNSRENSTDKKINDLYKKYNDVNNQLYSLKIENKTLKAQLRNIKTAKK